ncbi:MAG: radical SAM family heme chaperone HemW [Candidatus Rokubacteria bacterium]|nr:radical SAM family heme chaperone HemW [Candidatus Rokubacteria bacterium]
MAPLATAREDHLVGVHPASFVAGPVAAPTPAVPAPPPGVGTPAPRGGGPPAPRHPLGTPGSTPAEWTPRSRTLGAYLHTPFCRQRCPYCSFNTAPYRPAAMERFLAALGREIDLVGEANWVSGVTVGSVFVGGGTPSLLPADELAEILDRLRKRFAVAPNAEVTVECNPESVSREKLEGYRLAGVNRISLGVQTLNDALLQRLGRLHSAREARQAFEAARAAGIGDINVDLMYGLPRLDLAGWKAVLSGVLAWEPEHLSAYCLTLDEGSRWGSEGAPALPAEEVVTEQYWLLVRLGREAGLEHYEISNYCRPGFRSSHNQIYWRGEEYLALGPGAAGFLGDIRYTNVKPVERYCSVLEAGKLPLGQWERLTLRQQERERLILGLRLEAGIPRGWLDARMAEGPARLGQLIKTWEARGLLVFGDDRVSLTEAGFLLSDSLFVELL